MTSDTTKKYKRLSILFFVLSIIVTVAPLIAFTIVGFVNGEVHEKTALGISILVSLILVVLNFLMKMSLRSTIWILVLGIFYALRHYMDTLMIMVLVIAIGTIIDEFVLSPLHKIYKDKAKINKEIDKRL